MYILLNVTLQWGFLPKPELLLIMGCAMILDFITGIIKAAMIGEKRVSRKYRDTVIKFLQYGGAILIGMCISYLSVYLGNINQSWKGTDIYMSYFNSALIIYATFCEIMSSLENIYAANPKSRFAKYAIKPALKILTIELKKNPFTRLVIETDDDEIVAEVKKEDVVIKKTVL